ncbi:MAG: RNA polymerase sigma factor [Gammaproteobacteria bacterium]|jgi:RNA polymerase sigma-70 factor (ECF subfamily)
MSGFTDCSVDPAILKRARGGDMKAHEVLYRVYSTPVYTLAMRMLQSAALADEVLQETAIEVIRKLESLREPGAFPGWIKRVALNKCLAQLRSAWHRKASATAPDAEIGDGGWLEGSDHGTAAERLHGAMDLATALALLPPMTRSVVWLHDVEGMTHAEIGRIMGRTTSFSKSQLSRAHQRLRRLLGESDGEHECMPQPNNY